MPKMVGGKVPKRQSASVELRSSGESVEAGRSKSAARPDSAARQIMQVAEARVGDPDFMMSLARGLAVLRAFTDHHRPLSMSQISQEVGISRAAIRRALHTLLMLGYATETRDGFALAPRVLGIGNAYLSSFSLSAMAQPVLDALRDAVHESCSLGVLDGDEVLYVARAETVRIMSVGLRPGSRIPAYCSSMGRALLAHMEADDLSGYLQRVPLRPRTGKTTVERDKFHELLAKVRRQGYALVDQELELGLRSVAVPIFNRAGKAVAALNIGTQSVRVPLRVLEGEMLPLLVRAAAELQTKPI